MMYMPLGSIWLIVWQHIYMTNCCYMLYMAKIHATSLCCSWNFFFWVLLDMHLWYVLWVAMVQFNMIVVSDLNANTIYFVTYPTKLKTMHVWLFDSLTKLTKNTTVHCVSVLNRVIEHFWMMLMCECTWLWS